MAEASVEELRSKHASPLAQSLSKSQSPSQTPQGLEAEQPPS